MQEDQERVKVGTGRLSGFTLVELMIVMVIIIILSGMLLPALRAVRSMAYTADCANKLRQIGLATMDYVNSNNGYVYPCVPTPGLIDHWINLLYADYLYSNDQIFQCPEVRLGEGFNPYGGRDEYGRINHASYIMNAIQPGEWAGYSGSISGNRYGWNRGNGRNPIQLQETRASQAIFIVDIAAPLTRNSTGRMIMRFNETDHGVFDGVNGNGVTDSNERKVGNRHGGSFCALFGDGHVTAMKKSAADQWIAWVQP